MKFAKWIKPGTSEARIYINGASVDGKPFIAKQAGSNLWEVKCFGLYPTQLDNLTNMVESEIAAIAGGDCPAKFDEVLALFS